MDREEGVAPTPGGQGFDLDVSEDVQLLGDTGSHTPVEEYCGVLLDLPDRLGQALGIFAGNEKFMLLVIIIAREIQSATFHAVIATGTVTAGFGAVTHIEEKPLHVIPLQHLNSLCLQLVDIVGVVHAMVIPAGRQGGIPPLPVFIVLEMPDPIMMDLGIVFIHADTDVGWGHDPSLAAGFNLLAQ